MKLSIATINLVLRTNKTLADGTHPIMLRVSFHGLKERSTGFSSSPRFWDARNQCLKKGYPNFSIINQKLKQLKDEAIRRRDEFIANNEVYTPSMILSVTGTPLAASNDVGGLVARYVQEKGLNPQTQTKWRHLSTSLVKFSHKGLIVNEIDEGFCRRYARWLEDSGLAVGSIRLYLSKLVALLHYAVSLKLIDKFPLETWKYHRSYRESKSELYIHNKSMDVMIQMFLDEVVNRNGNRWTYKEGAIERLINANSELYAHYLYVVGYWMKGLAPVDISMLKKKDIKTIMVKDKNYYAIDGHRSKTGMPFKIRIPQNSILSNVLVRTFLMYNKGEYFLPTLNGCKGDLKKRVNNVYGRHAKHLYDWFVKVNDEIVKKNVNGECIPLIDLDCKYYSYRHSYIMHQIQQPNVNLLKLATESGKALTSLHQYLTYLNDEDLV